MINLSISNGVLYVFFKHGNRIFTYVILYDIIFPEGIIWIN